MPPQYTHKKKLRVETERFTLAIEKTMADKLRKAATKAGMSTTAYITYLILQGMNNEHLI